MDVDVGAISIWEFGLQPTIQYTRRKKEMIREASLLVVRRSTTNRSILAYE
jgi:hypothetical protein